MKTTYTTLDTYNINSYSQVARLAPAIGFSAGVAFTIAKLCGLFPDTSLAAIIGFDILCCLYLAIGLTLRKVHLQANGKPNAGIIQKMKVALLILLLIQWNAISYLFPTRDYWGFAPLFSLLLAFFYDAGLVLIGNIGLSISIALSWIIKGDKLLPVRGDMFAENLLFRIAALVFTFVTITVLTKLTEETLQKIYEHTEQLKLLANQQKKLERLVENQNPEERKKILEGTTILMVEDNALTRDINTEILEEEGAIVTQAESGQAAIDEVRKNGSFDVILMDIIMPGMDGIEATRRIRELEEGVYFPMPIIALTGENSDEKVQQILEAGASDCMNKPLVVGELSRILISIMKERSSAIGKRLEDTIRIANTDPLTNVKNITAYTDKVSELAEKMRSGQPLQFAVVLCDINDLKGVNDSQGHDAGDVYIQNCCRLICDTFQHSPVYRIGGDEFVAILQGKDLQGRFKLTELLQQKITEAEKIGSVRAGKASMAFGMASYHPRTDGMVSDVVKRADEAMYEQKKMMKARKTEAYK